MKDQLDCIEISINKNFYTIRYNGFSKKTADSTIIANLLNKDYGPLISYSKKGNDLILKFQKMIISIKSIRNINKCGNDLALFNYLVSINNPNILKLVKKKA